MLKRTLVTMLLGGVVAIGISGAAQAQNWPTRPIQVVVPFEAGGDTDFNARVLSKYLEPELHVAMPVINITGAGGIVGARQVKGAKPDGYNVLFFHTTFLTSQALGITDLTLDNYELVGIVGREDGNVIVVPAKAPYKTMKELMAASAANPGKISLTTNTGAMTWLIGAQLNNAGASFNFVDVGGAAGRLKAVLGGNIDVSQNPVAQVKPYVDNGELRVLATMSAERMTSLPDVPTLMELGYDIELRVEYFYLFPKGTPEKVITTFSNALKKVITENTKYADEIKKAYWQKPFWLGAEESKKRLTRMLENWKKVKL